MTAFFIDLTEPRKRVLIASDTLTYTLGAEVVPVGFSNKVIPHPSIGGAFCGTGVLEIILGAGVALLERQDVVTHEDAVDVLPEILRGETARFAGRHGIEGTRRLLLCEAVWIGRTKRGDFEMVVFKNHAGDYAAERGYSGIVAIPNVPSAYVPPGFNSIASPVMRALAGMRAMRRFTIDHGDAFGMPPIGGEIALTTLDRDGVSDRVIGRFDGLAEAQAAVEATRRALDRGDAASYLGLGGVNRREARPAALAELQRRIGVPQNRQQRRAAARAARTAA